MSFDSKKDNQISQSNNSLNKINDDCRPQTIIVFLAFKLIPILLYLLLKLLTDQVLLTFILVILLLSADFWFTKNIAGRQLAALRWYSQLSEDNLEKWCFQSSQIRVPSTFNVMVFWFGQFVPIVFWAVIFLINLITLSAFWSFLAIFCQVLLCSNFIFYLQCKGDHQKKVNNMTKRLGVQFFDLNQQKN